MASTDLPMQGFVRQAGAHEQLLAMGELISIIVPATLTDGQFSLIEHIVPPNGGPPPHTHETFETLYVLEGVFDVWQGELATATRADAGAIIFVPPGVAHTTRNAGSVAGRTLSAYAPGGIEAFFRAVGAPTSDEAALPDLNRPPDLSGLDPVQLQLLAERHGMRLVPWPTQS